MLPFSSLQVPPPANWQDFENLCWDLWREIWKDPNAQKNGRQGQPQHGVDVYGRPDQREKWAGVQCKGKDNYTNQKLTEREVKTEVEKAKSFTPALSEFIIATTGPKNAKIEELARGITKKHLEEGLFSIHVFGWRDIIARLEDFPNLIEKYYSWLVLNAQKLEKDIEKIEKPAQASSESTEVEIPVSSSLEIVEAPQIPASVDVSTAILTPEYKAELDDVQDLIDRYEPEEALQHLEKLEKRWLNPPNPIKYRLLVYRARAKLYQNQDHDAAKLLIKAWQYNFEEDKAFSNRAFGHLLLNQTEEAREYAKMALEKNPANSQAYSILAQTFSDEEKLENIIAQIPDHYRTTTEVAHTLGHLARRRGNFAEARKWLEVAIKNNKGSSSDLEAELGELLLESVMEDQSVIHMKQLSDLQEKQVREALQLLTSAWQRVDNTGIRNCRISWVASRGLAKKLLGDIEGAIRDIEIALSVKPSDPTFMINRAVLAYENNDNETAISLAKQILSVKESPEAVSLLAYALGREGRFLEAIEILEDILKTSSTENIKKEVKRLLILHYIESEDLLAAKNISDSLRTADPANILYLVDAARISRMSENPEEAILILEDAAKQITDSSPVRWLVELADEFYFLRQYDDAIRLYERIVDTSLKTPFTYRLLNCYYHSGKPDHALEICQTLRQKYGPLEFISEMEVEIYESIGGLVKARNICREYLNEFPDDFRMKLHLAVINLHSNSFEELDEFLNSSIDIGELSMEHGFLLARLYATRSLVKKAFETIYEVRRNFPNDGNAHVNYVIFFYCMEKDSCEWLGSTKVEKDAAVCIESESNKRKWYVIEDREGWDILREEINLEHPLAQKLMGKSVGDEILFKEDQFSTEYGKIAEIKSKYVYALHKSMSLISEIFPDVSGVWKIRVGSIIEEGEYTEGFQKILDMLTNRYETLRKVEQFYREKRMPIGTFAHLIRSNVIDVFEGLRRDPNLGVNCCLGTRKERFYAVSLLEKKPKLVVDIISLMTLHAIDAEDIITKTFGRLCIAQSTKDLLQQVIDERKNMHSRRCATIWMEGDKPVIGKVNAEEYKQNIERLEDILSWVKENCDVIPCKAALKMTREDREKFNEMIGQSFIDTILIASESEYLLYSDDRLLRSFAKTEFGVDGVWTQIVLIHSLEEKIIEKSEYQKKVIELVRSYYHFTGIDADTLIEAARQSEWQPSHPYTIVLQVLRGNSSDEVSALKIGKDFLYRLWKTPITPEQRSLLVLSLLDAIAFERDPDIVLQKLESLVKKRFSSQSLYESRVIFLIDLWKQMQKH